jgi:uncharacterized protein (TIGR02599 family)
MKSYHLPLKDSNVSAFTLVEILVSLAVLTILLLINAEVIGQVQSTWSASNARVSQFREARTAFDIITRNLSQATLNSYVDYTANYLAQPGVPVGVAAAPGGYRRNSDLHFISGPAATLVNATGGGAGSLPGHAVFFQAPLGITESPSLVGLDRLLCGRGYFVQYTSDAAFAPSFLPPGDFHYRYRLMEYSPPAERNAIYSSPNWYADAGAAINIEETATNISNTRPVADNILALIISPRRELTVYDEAESPTGPTGIANDYNYDSRVLDNASPPDSPQGTQHLLPPLIRVVLVAIDEKSAQKLEEASGSGSSPPLGAELDKFSQANRLDKEIEQVVTELRAQKLNYRVFSATIQLRGAKWSL